MSGTTYYQRNREVMLNRANKYYENNKEVLREKAKNKYRELSEEEKNIKREYGRNRYHNMSEEDKKRLKEYQKFIVRLKASFIDVKNQLIVLSKKIHIVIKVRFKIAMTKIFFISACINSVKDKTGF